MPLSYSQLADQIAPAPSSDLGYRSVRNADGTWTVKDVEVFASHERFGKKFDRDWLEGTIARHQARRSEGYKPPLHIQHHGSGSEVELAGHFELTGVQAREYAGTETEVLLADFTDLPDPVYREMAKGRLPYRSVEILDVDTPEIDSIALLKHDVPYFRFANLKPTEVDQTNPTGTGTSVDVSSDDPHHALSLAYSAVTSNGQCTALFKGGGHWADKNSKTQGGHGSAPDPNSVSPVGGKDETKSQQLDEGSDEAAEERQTPAIDLAQAQKLKVEAFRDAVDVLQKLLREISSSANPPPIIEEDTVADSEPVTGGPVTMSADQDQASATTPADAIVTGAAADAAGAPAPANSAEYAALKGELAAMKAQLTKYQKAQDTNDLVTGALNELAAYGLNDESVSELKALAADGGESAVKAYVAAVKRCGTPDPDTSDIPSDESVADEVSECPEVAAYADKGPAAMKLARLYAVQYDSAPEHYRRGQSKREFIDAAVEMELRNAAAQSEDN